MLSSKRRLFGLLLFACFPMACGAYAPEQSGPVTSQSVEYAEEYSRRFQNDAAVQQQDDGVLQEDEVSVTPEIPATPEMPASIQAPQSPLPPLPYVPVPGLEQDDGIVDEGHLPDGGDGSDNLEDFPTFEIECRGEPTACEQFASGPTWINDCAAQQGCDVQYGCKALDASTCGVLTDATTCAEQGCLWQTPQVAQDANAASVGLWQKLFGSWLITRDKEALTGHKSEGFLDSLKHRPPVYLKDANPQEVELPGICVVPPELSDTAALCAQQASLAACDAWAAFCTWKPVGCQGQSFECVNFIEEQACEAQHGCIWASVY